MNSLDLGVIGNCTIAALIDRQARIVWSCFPRLDGDPAFCSLLDDRDDRSEPAGGFFSVEMESKSRIESSYVPNTAVLSTTISDDNGNTVEVVDFAPRFREFERVYRPPMILRRIQPISGRPRIRIRVRPRFDYGAVAPTITRGSNHIRYVSADHSLRLTTNAPLSYVVEETPFVLDRPISFFFGADERVQADIERTGRELLERTIDFWRDWVRSLSIPFEWQEAVIRAAISLKLCNFEETGAIVAALTTSIPEAQGTERNWDYRFCWLRDAYFVIHALNRLGATRTMEDYIGFINDVVDDAAPDRLRPVYGIARSKDLDERTAESLGGYRGHRPVRVGNAAHLQVQNDSYGNVILASTHSFFDRRLIRSGADTLFERLERLGQRAAEVFDQPDAGPWELRNSSTVHTFSSLICWAGCNRLAKIAVHLGKFDRAEFWENEAARLAGVIATRAWNAERNCFVSAFGGREVDASLLLMPDLGFIEPMDPRYLSTLAEIEKDLDHGSLVYRYSSEDDFGRPSTAFVICGFWLVDALAAVGRRDEARERFEKLIGYCNSFGLLSEDVDLKTGELWGNFPQTYSMVGLINSAVRLSKRWGDEL